MWAVLVEPIDEGKQLTTTCIPSVGNQDSSRALILQALDQTLDHGDAAMLADGTVAWWLDASTLNPTSKSVAIEDAISIADDVLRDSASTRHCASQESAHIPTTRSIVEDTESHGATGKWSITVATQ